ncbi:DUF917 domain-containing protein [Kytococcus sedentarius]|uniref:Uncharacterized conserved protein n=1 Tax=Kytococcus sedentarius (strain ATCC 14392 / DSM 20547 / JCM 11482 / CCUG 33030 / NBRC 15357 / NCTC 11040 / CCM 314 / 541) TaxID=478801 RepID=C7NM14_KYTSD|nr:DUF917 domain-containing protein [Kytococcus sedentarius]ACV07263.1 uncharacterized conserved protein [Kytococcus sedentarius DSM 20547]QQB63229.1 DUF917 domain-containing protein [Kytococcus sedentarius]STX13901.1 Uncharacterized conserved protein [Kytococcus sedentarius]
MQRWLGQDDLDDYLTGCHVLGGGGGGSPWFLRPALLGRSWPVTVRGLDELPAETVCVAVGMGGSTMVMTERLPPLRPFDGVIAAIEHWTRKPAEAVCTAEIGGLNGGSALLAGEGLALLDADLMGRALPDVDQFGPLVDGVPGVVLACATGGEGVMTVTDARPEDAEFLLRHAFECAGGWAAMAIGGLTVGDLREHAVPGSVSRALELGRAGRRVFEAGDDPRALAEGLGGELIGTGRVHAVAHEAGSRRATVTIDTDAGEVLRVIAASEYLVAQVDGRVVAQAPDVIALAAHPSWEVLAPDAVSRGQTVVVMRLPAPEFWRRADRAHAVGSARYRLGLAGGAA